MNFVHPFRQKLKADYATFLDRQSQRFPEQDTLRIDLHCHDANSDVPDELWGRILRLPETWLKTSDLFTCLRGHGVDVLTVTNHNNARSCWEAEEAGIETLPGAEFTCKFPEYEISVHVLCYGFSPLQEEVLKKLRRNIYQFLEYCRTWNLPTVLPHPLYFYSPRFSPPPCLFEKFALMFERFEVVNGQRDLWQNLMTVAWLESITPEKLELWSKKHGIRPDQYCADPYRKHMTGGSDDHMGLFAGSCGTRLYLPNLSERLKRNSKVELALEALRSGEMAPFGLLGEEEKLNVAFLDYFCQVALNMEDPGLVRMFLHRGSLRDKLLCLAIGNGMQEIKRHRYTMRFFRIFHEALAGKRPGVLATLASSRDYRPLLEQIDCLAKARLQGPSAYMTAVRVGIPDIFSRLNDILAQRLTHKLKKAMAPLEGGVSLGSMIQRLEVPMHLRALFGGEATATVPKHMSRVNLGELFDQVSFPALASMLIAGSAFASSKVLYNNRRFLDSFSRQLGAYTHPHRALWITDTFADRNGVSSALEATLREVARKDLPIDFLACHRELESRPHLSVVRPIAEFRLPGYPDQVFRIPDLLQIQRLFREGGYDRIICSTELLMGPIALFLKKAFNVPAYFYMHTDWLDYMEKNTALEEKAIDRVRRFLRAFYKQFDGMFVLNEEHRDWLTSPAMALERKRVFKTAHWSESHFWPRPRIRSEIFPGVSDNAQVLLFAGRLSAEKGVLDLPGILAKVREQHPGVRMVLAGTGPAEPELRELMPDACFLGWVDANALAEVYSSADLLLLPSRFDTFGCVVLEALSCGLPVAAYDTKGPRDILKHQVTGLLSHTAEEMAAQISHCLAEPSQLADMRRAAFLRSDDYRAEDIMLRLMQDIGLAEHPPESAHFRLQFVTTFSDEEPSYREDGNFFAEILEMVNVD